MKAQAWFLALAGALAASAALLINSCKPSKGSARSAAEKELAAVGYELNTASLLQAAATNDVAAIEQMVAAGYDVKSAEAGTGQSALHLAAQHSALEVAEYLLNRGVAIDCLDAAGRTPLMAAAMANQPKATRWLLRHGADPRLTDAEGFTPLFLAIRAGHSAPIEELSSFCRDELNDGLLLASMLGSSAVIDTLTNYGASVYARMDDGRTPLMLAAENGHLEAVSLLLDIGASRYATTEEGITALQLAQQNNHLAIAELIEKGIPSEPLRLESSLEVATALSAVDTVNGPQNSAELSEAQSEPEDRELALTDRPHATHNHTPSDASQAAGQAQAKLALLDGAQLVATGAPRELVDRNSSRDATTRTYSESLQAERMPEHAPKQAPLIMRYYRERELPVTVEAVGAETATLRIGSKEPLVVREGATLPNSRIEVVRIFTRIEQGKLNDGKPIHRGVVEVLDTVSGATSEWISGQPAAAHPPTAIVEDVFSGRRFVAQAGQRFTAADGTSFVVAEVRPDQLLIENIATGELSTIPLRGPRG